jgi:hypothetical protein
MISPHEKERGRRAHLARFDLGLSSVMCTFQILSQFSQYRLFVVFDVP